MSLLQVKNLVVEFPSRKGTLRALDQVSFDIAPGEILGVVGESGAGKSLTGAAIIGLLEPPGRVASGQIVLEGQRIEQRQMVEPVPSMDVGLTWPNTRPLSAPAQVFRAFISGALGSGK